MGMSWSLESLRTLKGNPHRLHNNCLPMMQDHPYPSSSMVQLGSQGVALTYSKCSIKADESNQERHTSWVGVQARQGEGKEGTGLAP